MFVLKIRFLNGYRASRKHSEIDWPPAPARLHSAAVDTYHRRTDKEPDFLRAIEFVEEERLPEIHCGRLLAGRLERTCHYVPLNKPLGTDEGLADRNIHHRRQREYPIAQPDHDSVYFVWPDAQPRPEWGHFARLAARIPYLGQSTSMVIVSATDVVPDNLLRYVPDPEGRVNLAGYYKGRMAELNACFNTGQEPYHSPCKYRLVGATKPRPEDPCFYEQVHYLKLEGAYKLIIQAAPTVANAVRAKLLNICHSKGIQPPAICSGENRPHLSYLPLSFVGNDYGNGLLYGLAIGIPGGLDRDEFAQVESAIHDLDEVFFNSERWSLSAAEGHDLPKTLKAETWEGPSLTWGTVTPAEFKYRVGLEQEVRKHCGLLGLPEPQVQVLPDSLFRGSKPAREFFTRNTLVGRESGNLFHMKLTFPEQVRGPVAIGHGRNFGLGLCKPLRRPTWQRN